MSLQDMQAMQARFPEGAVVQIHDDPIDPQRAVLEPGNRTGEWVGRRLGFSCVVFGAIVFVLGLGLPALPLGATSLH